MNDALKEQVSALMDDELRRQEQALLLRQVSRAPELAAQVGRYGLIGEAMRRSLPPVIDTDLANRVSSALESEASLHVPQRRLVRHVLLRPLAGLAVAASVAAVSIAIWAPAQGPDGVGGEFAAQGSSPGGGEFTAVHSSAGSQGSAAQERYDEGHYGHTAGHWDRLEPQIQQRLNDYLVNHSEHSATGRFGGMLNYVRITGHPNDE